MSNELERLFIDLDEITAPFSFYRTVKPIRTALASRDFKAAYTAAGDALHSTEIRGPMLRADLTDWRTEAKAHSESQRGAIAA